eukprot:2438500-Amphidinium_carterae.2
MQLEIPTNFKSGPCATKLALQLLTEETSQAVLSAERAGSKWKLVDHILWMSSTKCIPKWRTRPGQEI